MIDKIKDLENNVKFKNTVIDACLEQLDVLQAKQAEMENQIKWANQKFEDHVAEVTALKALLSHCNDIFMSFAMGDGFINKDTAEIMAEKIEAQLNPKKGK